MIFPFILFAVSRQNRKSNNDAVLIQRISRKDQQALSDLYDTYSSLLYGLILGIVHNKDDAEDLLQEVFVQIWEKASQFDTQKASVYTWLVTISRNKAIDHLRSRAFKNNKKNVSDAEEFILPMLKSDTNTPLDTAILQDRTEIISRALDQIPVDQREVITIAYFKGYTQSEISDELNLPLGTVKTRMRQGMKKLKEFISPNS